MNKDLRLHGSMKERGAIKWTSLMLPEHIVQLREWQAEDSTVERPDLTDWNLDAIQEEIEIAYKHKCNAWVQNWQSGKITKYFGTIEEIDIHSKSIILADPFGVERIKWVDIISVQSAESSRWE
ncbi:YolD-like family protein [Sporosarcina sp. Te-1]|uniref:YolD-like family protein n=1 Tax=Sporosarcina sp. Te-1 TaxID=2818390 RepID=UPI001A9DBED9|nr:YolD-like family protein [Sporosarcina sp. Te-1]QTD41965.1 YolD-like family protein [Sporosarcina sp. Te-1]